MTLCCFLLGDSGAYPAVCDRAQSGLSFALAGAAQKHYRAIEASLPFQLSNPLLTRSLISFALPNTE